MFLDFLAALFGRRMRLPADRVTRIPRAAKKAAKAEIEAMVAAIEAIAALPALADVKENKRLPRGFYSRVQEYSRSYDAFVAVVGRYFPVEDARRPGEPGGCGACHAAPMGLHTIETLNIYREFRTHRRFSQIAQRMGELGERQFQDIQAGHKGKDPEKIRMGSRAMQEGRLTFARRREPCPFLNVEKERCQIWEHRPMVCRMHHPVTPPEISDPTHEDYPKAVKGYNLRPPIKVQVLLRQIDKRMMLQLSPFMYAGVLQLAQLADGQLLQEVGEAPRRMQEDGQISRRANRSVPHAKKYKKGKKKKRR